MPGGDARVGEVDVFGALQRAIVPAGAGVAHAVVHAAGVDGPERVLRGAAGRRHHLAALRVAANRAPVGADLRVWWPAGAAVAVAAAKRKVAPSHGR